MDLESQETSEKAYVMEHVQQIEPSRIVQEESQAPQAVQLDVPELLQKPELPTGCESVALTMALMYEGYDLEKTTIADEYLVYSEDGDFTRGYVGDPKSRQGSRMLSADNCRDCQQLPVRTGSREGGGGCDGH